MSQFIIHHCEPLGDSRWQLIGDLMDGDVSAGDSIVLAGQNFEVLAIALLDELSEKVDYIGLTISAQALEEVSGLSAQILNTANI
jgi:hypothetical protein